MGQILQTAAGRQGDYCSSLCNPIGLYNNSQSLYQDFDLGVINFGLDNRPDKLRSDMAPPKLEHNMPQYRSRPNNSDEISSFIDHVSKTL